jgi:hypothetical protein
MVVEKRGSKGAARSASSARPGASTAQKSKARRTLWIVLIIAAVLVAIAWFFRVPATGYAQTATAYSARVGCSCRFVAERDLDQCSDDKLGGMELVTLVEDVQEKSVTARFPLVSTDTAFYREGYGCVLEEWDD